MMEINMLIQIKYQNHLVPIITMDQSYNQYLHKQPDSIYKQILSLLIYRIHPILMLINGYIQHKLKKIMYSFKNQILSYRGKIEKGQGNYFNLKISFKVIQEIVIYCLLLLELYKNILNQFIDYMFYKRILRIYMV